MLEFFAKLFDSDFMPHGHCYFWSPGIIGLHVTSDALIALSYYSIPLALAYFVSKRKDLAFRWIYVMFGIFIFSCGTTHLMDIWTIWHGTYRLQGLILLATSLVSAATAAILWPLIPRALSLPSPGELAALNKNLESKVEERTAQLKASNEQFQQFAYLASHDLTAPIRRVNSFLQLLEKTSKGALNEEALDYLKSAQDSSWHMHQLVEGLLAFCRLDSFGKQFHPASMEKALQQALSNLGPQIEETGAIVTHTPLPVVPIDETLMTQVFQNLISNAIKYRRERVLPEIRISAELMDGAWTFSVQDNGIGIEAPYLEKIFGLFQKLHPREQYDGSGLGLAICKKIVERHGGKIWVESEPEKGSNFIFRIPESH